VGFLNILVKYKGDAAADIIRKTLFGGDLGLGWWEFTYYPAKKTSNTA
jgi:hypothetical protein